MTAPDNTPNRKLRIIPSPEHFHDTQVGDMWHTPENDKDGRECWVIHLPDDPPGGSGWPNLWTTRTGYPDQMWEVSGEPPNITVSPSIFCSPPTGWHGFIRDGELVDA